MNSKLGMFSSVVAIGVLLLFVPVSSVVNAQENDRYYEDYQKYEIDRKSYSDVKYKEDKKKEPSMLLVKKDVLYCDVIANGTDLSRGCSITDESTVVGFEGPDSDRYVQECTLTEGDEGRLCESLDEDAFTMMVTDDIKIPGSKEGTKITFNGERYTVTEDVNIGEIRESIDSLCQKTGFDSGFIFEFVENPVFICTVFDNCSGIVEDKELKECTFENYLVFID